MTKSSTGIEPEARNFSVTNQTAF